MVVASLNIFDGLSVKDVMSEKVLTVYEGWSVKRLAGFFVKHNISGAPVIAADDELVGVVTQSDVVRFESREPTDAELEKLVQFYCGPHGGKLSKSDLQHMRERASENCTVNSIMTPAVIAVDISFSATEACKLLIKKDLHRLFVTRNNKLVGVVSSMDFLRHLLVYDN